MKKKQLRVSLETISLQVVLKANRLLDKMTIAIEKERKKQQRKTKNFLFVLRQFKVCQHFPLQLPILPLLLLLLQTKLSLHL